MPAATSSGSAKRPSGVDVPPFGEGHLGHRLRKRKPGTRNERMESSPPFGHLRHRRLPMGLRPDIQRMRRALGALLAHQCRHAPGSAFIQIGHGDARALGSEPEGRGLPDSRTGTCDQRHLPLQSHPVLRHIPCTLFVDRGGVLRARHRPVILPGRAETTGSHPRNDRPEDSAHRSRPAISRIRCHRRRPWG
jgi:hypothetical protein